MVSLGGANRTLPAGQAAARAQAGRPLRRFVIFGIGRSGSSLLVDMLNAQPRVLCDFLVSPEPVPDPYAAMRSRAMHAAGLGASAYGVRLLVPHLAREGAAVDIPALLRRARADGWAVIHISRSSLLRVAISFVHASEHGFHLRPEDGPWRYEPMTIDLEELSHWLTVVVEWAKIEHRALAGTGFCEVIYERDLATESSQQATVGRIMKGLLGAEAVPVRTEFRRQMPTGDLADLVANYGDVMRFLDRAGLSALAGR